MAYTTIISTTELEEHLHDENQAIFDCRFSPADPERGVAHYARGHIPGARYVHLNEDLSGTILPGRTGRHPLPDPATLADRFSQWGIDRSVQVVVYDDMGGAMAARLWWMLRWLGHDAAAVLDGGWPAWQRERRAVSRQVENRQARVFTPMIQAHLLVATEEVMAKRIHPGTILLDARSSDRYHGQNETIDPVAGHIPGARSAPFSENLDERGYFRSAKSLEDRFTHLSNGLDVKHVMIYCGSGVTATHNLLAMARAGLGDARLYAGSWSEWITDPSRPLANSSSGETESD